MQKIICPFIVTILSIIILIGIWNTQRVEHLAEKNAESAIMCLKAAGAQADTVRMQLEIAHDMADTIAMLRDSIQILEEQLK